MKPKGYILFCYYDWVDGFGPRHVEICDLCTSFKELMSQYNGHWDDKWDTVKINLNQILKR
jgi:hypothetical protein